MLFQRIRSLDEGFEAEVDVLDEQAWYAALQSFSDANIYQTWAYGTVVSGRNVRRLILRKHGRIVAIAQARIASIPFLPAGIAHVLWGPLWQRDTGEADNIFRQAIRALRNEFVCKRGLTLRLVPMISNEEGGPSSAALIEEGFTVSSARSSGRTIVMDISPSIAELREGMKSHWQRELKAVERKALDVVEGTREELFTEFIDIYREMVSRKRFVEPNDINQFKLIQDRLPEKLKMKIVLCKSAGETCAGAICSAVGKTAVYLFGATSNAGMKSRGSYLLQWKLIEALKQDGVTAYDLNGINPATNPGTYKFKSDLAGRNGKDICYLGRFESQGNLLSYLCVRGGEGLRFALRSITAFVKVKRPARLWLRFAK